jgi:uncharacterized membrane protein YbaN (DUF454 family)
MVAPLFKNLERRGYFMRNRKDGSNLEIELDDRSGLVRVSDDRLFHPASLTYARRLLEALRDSPGVRKAEIDFASSTCRVDFDHASNASAVIAGVFADAVNTASARPQRETWWRRIRRSSTLSAFGHGGETSVWETRADPSGRIQLLRVERIPRSIVARPGSDVPVRVANRWKRLGYLAMAGGAFTLTVVGVVVPGIPTVPFLLATSYYLARSSTRMNEWLLRTEFFGPILQEWEGHASLSLASKCKLIGLSATIIVVTVVIVPLNPVALGVIFLMSAVSIYGTVRIPTLTSEPPAGVRGGIGGALPLAAH